MTIGFAPLGREIDLAQDFVDAEQGRDDPRTDRDLVLDGPIGPVPVEMGEPVPLGQPEQVAVLEELPVGGAGGEFDRADHVGGAAVGEQLLDRARGRIGGEESDLLRPSVDVGEDDPVA